MNYFNMNYFLNSPIFKEILTIITIFKAIEFLKTIYNNAIETRYFDETESQPFEGTESRFFYEIETANQKEVEIITHVKYNGQGMAFRSMQNILTSEAYTIHPENFEHPEIGSEVSFTIPKDSKQHDALKAIGSMNVFQSTTYNNIEFFANRCSREINLDFFTKMLDISMSINNSHEYSQWYHKIQLETRGCDFDIIEISQPLFVGDLKENHIPYISHIGPSTSLLDQ